MERTRLPALCLVCALLLSPLGVSQPAGASPLPIQLHQPRNEFRVHTIDVDQGQAVLVQTLAGKNILIDAGEDYAAPRMVAYLKKLGVQKIDWLMISHRHMDHIGGVFELANAFPVENVVTPWSKDAVPKTALVWMSPLRKKLDQAAGGANASNFFTGTKGKTFDFGGGAQAEIVWPPKPTGQLRIGDYNEESMVARISQKPPSGRDTASFVVGGDLGWQLERHLAQVCGSKIRADGMVGNHHGSKGSFEAKYLEAVAGRPSKLLDAVDSRLQTKEAKLAHEVMQRCRTREGKFLASELGLELYGHQQQQQRRDPLVNKLADYFRQDADKIPWMTYSAGIDNPYQHPNSERMALAALLGTTMLGTDMHGNVIMLRKLAPDGKWVPGRWEGHTINDQELPLPKVTGNMPAYKKFKDPRNPYDDTARMANYVFSIAHPDPTIPWGEKASLMPERGQEANAKFLQLAREARAGRAAFVRDFRAKMSDPSTKTQTLEDALAKVGTLWHGVKLTKAPWVQEGRIIMLDRGARSTGRRNEVEASPSPDRRGNANQNGGRLTRPQRREQPARSWRPSPTPRVRRDANTAWQGRPRQGRRGS